ncbi:MULTISPECIES: hypothetical protein [unclassified Arcicella]|uniref:hypothetical protein n=1 Tax=unclassified Arcicella TaxID=2644986 RepID=UPI00285C7DE0|nr:MULTISPECIES: hypothetical protein [unclassified Arcicella]MDR6560017.1 hypothetical protein [Arcicella sp. BE51]MDR6810376.1 hypothetical protein [Arcicella sp. BE140]MDR6821726.1 hypothetical protein [Arcicella sp. BE139]
MIALTINDETAIGKITNQIILEFDQEIITVKDLIQMRVYQEVANYNNRLSGYFQGLVQPSETGNVLNGYKSKERRKIDPEKQLYIALDAFQKNGYFVLIDNRQAEALDEQILLSSSMMISFVKLTPLIGG